MRCSVLQGVVAVYRTVLLQCFADVIRFVVCLASVDCGASLLQSVAVRCCRVLLWRVVVVCCCTVLLQCFVAVCCRGGQGHPLV